MLVSSDGRALTVSPYTGELLGTVPLPGGVHTRPIVADRSLYVLTDDAELSGHPLASPAPSPRTSARGDMVVVTVAIVGRPNVGKSTLFNRLVGRRAAIVDSEPGVTRDRREGVARLGPLRFRVWDTAGFETAAPTSLRGRMRAQTERAAAEADVALLLIDARAGVTPLDEQFAGLLRKRATPLILVANKCEGGAGGRPAVWTPSRLASARPCRYRPSTARASISSTRRSRLMRATTMPRRPGAPTRSSTWR